MSCWRAADLQVAHWYIEASLSEVDAAKAAFYPDINLMAFLQQDALHLSDFSAIRRSRWALLPG